MAVDVFQLRTSAEAAKLLAIATAHRISRELRGPFASPVDGGVPLLPGVDLSL